MEQDLFCNTVAIIFHKFFHKTFKLGEKFFITHMYYTYWTPLINRKPKEPAIFCEALDGIKIPQGLLVRRKVKKTKQTIKKKKKNPLPVCPGLNYSNP